MYYTGRALRGVKERYPQMKKLAFALVSKFKPYFQAYTVITLIDKPLQRAISSLKAAGQMALWAIKLSKFDIKYRSRMAIKG